MGDEMIEDMPGSQTAKPADVKNMIEKMVGRNRFVIKQKSSADLMRYTRSDEG
jgi:hypothetical protein